MYGWFVSLLNRSFAGAVLIAAVLAARFLLRRAPRKYVCLLWALAAIRLVCPVSFHSALSAFNYIGWYHANDGQLSYMQYTGHAEKPEMEIRIAQSIIGGSDGPTMVMHTPSVYLPTLMGIWAAGMAVLVIYAFISCLRVHRGTREHIRLEHNIYLCDGIPTPFILGIFRPRIFLPAYLRVEEMNSVIAHERAHIRRLDHVWKPLGYLLLCIHWFNPAVWLAYGLLCRDIELACDEKVIASMTVQEKKEYASVLLRCSAPAKLISACPLAFGEVGVKRRIRSIVNYRRPAFWAVLLAAAVSLALAVSFLTNPEKHEQTGSPLMGFVEYLPAGYSLRPEEDGHRCTLLKNGQAVGSISLKLLDLQDFSEETSRDYAWEHQKELWTEFGIDFDNGYLEYMTSASASADCMGWFGIYDPQTQTSKGENHYLYLVSGGAYDLAVSDENQEDELLSHRFREYLTGKPMSRQPQTSAETFPVSADTTPVLLPGEPEVTVRPTDISTDFGIYAGNDRLMFVSGVESAGSAGVMTADGGQYWRYIFTAGEDALIYVADAPVQDGKARWVLCPQDSGYANVELRPGMEPIPIYCNYVLWDTLTDRFPVRIEADAPMAQFPLPKGYAASSLWKSDILVSHGSAIVAEIRRDSRIGSLLESRRETDILAFLDDGGEYAYAVEFFDNAVCVNRREIAFPEETEREIWLFEKDGGTYSLTIFMDMISRSDAETLRTTLGVGG